MAKHIIKTSPHKFFLLNRQELVKISAIGALSGAVAIILTGWLGFDQMLINFRVGLIIALVLGLVLLLKQQVESALLIVVFSLIVLWHQWVQFAHFWQALVFYAALASVVMTLFGWVAQLKNWRLRLSVGMVAMVLLSLI